MQKDKMTEIPAKGTRRRAGRQEYHKLNNNMQKDWQTGIVQREYADVHCIGIQVYRNTLMYFRRTGRQK
jgi:hypothetical protein